MHRTDPADSRWAYLPVWVAFWSSLILYDVVHDLVEVGVYDLPGRSLPWMLKEWSAFWGTWVLISLAIAVLARRYNPDRMGWPRALAVHICACLVVGVAQLAVAAPIFQWLSSDGLSLLERFGLFLRGLLTRNLLIYWTLLGAAWAWNFWLASRTRALEAAKHRERAARLELAMAETQLATLRRDLDPHFLFNALNGLSALVRTGDRDTAIQTISRLGKLLRSGLDRAGQPLITLEEEIDTAREYLEIERLRMGDRMHLEWDVDPALLGHPVPAFVLQPLAENAVRHGVGASTRRISVRVAARAAEGWLCLDVQDTGPGPGSGAPGLGLGHTRQRLTLLYRDDASLSLDRVPGGGTRARIQIPLAPGFASTREAIAS